MHSPSSCQTAIVPSTATLSTAASLGLPSRRDDVSKSGIYLMIRQVERPSDLDSVWREERRLAGKDSVSAWVTNGATFF
jgi:hypothetical protein